MMAPLVVLLLHPVFEEDGVLRVVATGVAQEDVLWSVDGVEVGRTRDREPLELTLSAGAHNVSAASRADGSWQAVGRRDDAGEGATFVAAWTAVHEANPHPRQSPDAGDPPWPRLSLVLAALSLVLLVVPGRRGLEARRRRHRVED